MPYETMMYAGIASTAVFLAVSAVIFVQLDIRSVIGHLSGSAERKAIRQMESDASGSKNKAADRDTFQILEHVVIVHTDVTI